MVEQPRPLLLIKSDGKSSQAINRETALFADLQFELAGLSLIDLFPKRLVFSFQAGQLLFRSFFSHNTSLRAIITGSQRPQPGIGRSSRLFISAPKNNPFRI